MRKKQKPYARPTAKALASRAIFNEASGMLPTVQLTFELVDGEVVTFEISVHETANLIEMATASYHAIVPQLKTGRSPFIG